MEHVDWISIEKIKGRGTYCLNSIDKSSCKENDGEALENPGITQKIELWRQRLKDFQMGKNLRPFYDSQVSPQNVIDDRYDENRWALLSYLAEARKKMAECVTGYGAAYKDNLAQTRLFGCREGVTITTSQGYTIAPDFPYPSNINRVDSVSTTDYKDLNCFPYNAEYLTKTEKKGCAENKDRTAGCLSSLSNPSNPYTKDKNYTKENNYYIYSNSLDDFYCTSGRKQIAK
jgi:hypothetical protein